ncbi:MAG: hypothetical protein KIS96_10800 [Bauldia sp.]|nr:hypothetical protein [Bauldia sp.]
MKLNTRPTLGLIASAALIAAPLLAFPGAAFATEDDDDDDQQILICHQISDNNYELITIDVSDLQEHLQHGDAFPAQASAEVDVNCDTLPFSSSLRVETAELQLAAAGWAVAVCPPGTRAISGGYAPETTGVTVSELAVAGMTYGDFTFGPDQTGWVVQASDVASIKVFVDCEPIL